MFNAGAGPLQRMRDNRVVYVSGLQLARRENIVLRVGLKDFDKVGPRVAIAISVLHSHRVVIAACQHASEIAGY